MARYRERSVPVEGTTFEEMERIELAKSDGKGSFPFGWRPVSRDGPDKFLVTHRTGIVIFNRGEVLVTSEIGEIFTLMEPRFRELYELISD